MGEASTWSAKFSSYSGVSIIVVSGSMQTALIRHKLLYARIVMQVEMMTLSASCSIIKCGGGVNEKRCIGPWSERDDVCRIRRCVVKKSVNKGK